MPFFESETTSATAGARRFYEGPPQRNPLPSSKLTEKSLRYASSILRVHDIWCVAFILYVTVNKFEPDRRLALVLKFLILAVGAAAIARLLMR